MSTDQPPLSADPDVIQTWLSLVYADTPGLLSACSDADGWAGRRFTTDAAGLAAATAYVTKLDRRRPKGIYTQVTTLREQPDKGRGGEDLAHTLTHLWADGDFGTIGHKPGLDDLPAPPDEDAVAKVVTESGLPEPSGWAHSGGGYNPIWLLAENHIITDDTRSQFKALTMTWQAILAAQAHRHGWSWDTEVGNLDRLMKLPGTVNRKEGLERATRIGPGSGNAYQLADLVQVAEEHGPAARQLLAEAAREKQQRRNQRLGVKPTPAPRRKQPRDDRPLTGEGPLDVLADHLEFADILEPEGWTYVGTHTDSRHMWKRPAIGGESSSPYSLLCDDHVAVNFSDRSDLPVGAQPGGRKLTVPYLWAHYNYGGDVSAAASDILRAAAGRDTHGPAGGLATAVLDDVKRRCGITDPPRPAREDINWEGLEDPSDPEEPEGGADGEPDDRLPLAFWNATPTLQQIRQMAQARRTSPDAVMHALLARLAALTEPSVRVDSGIHKPATLCWFCGLYGPSGAGKGNAESTAAELAPFPDSDLTHIDISTGQGLIASYLELQIDPEDDGKKKILVQKTARGYALATEGSVLDAMAQMSAAATLNGVLCKAWMSERQGTSNAEVERRRSLPESSYTFSMSLGVQQEPAAKLLEMGSIGLPQRLAWAHAQLGPDTPKERPSLTGAVKVTLADGTDTPVTHWAAGLHNTTIKVPASVTQELDDLLLAISFGRGQEAPLDTHEPLWRVKCAALLALLHGRTSVTTEDWERATLMWQTSRRVRDSVQDEAKRRLRAEADARRAEAVQTAVESQSAVYEAMHGVHPSVVNVAKRAHRYLTRKGSEMSARDVNRATVKKADRDRYKSAGEEGSLWTASLRYGVEHGWLVPLSDGAVLTAGSVAPEGTS
ncbi:hypothetical protein ABZ341_36220 [Streptomyces sp. NPDC006173]|uniref:hypothetical protein n=1 Tax=Streptomyces sp. NPDC006173 TaxID=3155349 RepID=UPI00340F7B7E